MADIDKTWPSIETPALLIDLDVMEGNIQRWQAAFDAAGVAFRPHIKTHKSPAIAACQLAAGAVGLAVAKVAEAEVFAAAGFRDLSVAYPVVGVSKWRRLAELARACSISVNVDSELAARGLSDAAVAAGSVVGVLLDINIGGNRTGVPPADAEALGRLVVSLPGLRLEGITGYRSATFPGAAGRSPAEVGREEGELLVQLAARLRAVGLPIRTVAAGSTPTAHAAVTVPGITEVRAGTYVFGDRYMAGLGAHSEDEIALTVLCTVASRPLPERATIDGGTKTFSGDIPGGALPGLQGYARAVEIDAFIEAMNEEHGMLRLAPGVSPQVGDTLRLIPNHACTTVNLSDELIGIRDGRIVSVWPIEARGKRT
ncbi:MAG TPA: alanine racemase [Thermomicrobiales bacterium]|nr:alanine racemase [Thermomicrobiales bacterium]